MALVGTPCQVKAFRNMASGENAARKFTYNVRLVVGIFCSRCFTYEGFFKKILVDQLDIDLSNVAKFDLKGERFVIYQKGKPKRELALDALEQFTPPACSICSDFSAELADISVGSAGSLEGYSTVILRTELGRQIFKQGIRAGAYEMESLNEGDPGMDRIRELSSEKKEEARKEIIIRKRMGKPLPPRVEKVD